MIPRLRTKPRIIAVVHEILDNEIEEFSKYMAHTDIYLNEDKSLYYALSADGKGRWAKASAILSNRSAYLHGLKSLWSVKGNTKGKEGNLLGGMLVFDSDEKGLIYHKYEDFGGYDYNQILEAANKITSNNSNGGNNSHSNSNVQQQQVPLSETQSQSYTQSSTGKQPNLEMCNDTCGA